MFVEASAPDGNPHGRKAGRVIAPYSYKKKVVLRLALCSQIFFPGLAVAKSKPFRRDFYGHPPLWPQNVNKYISRMSAEMSCLALPLFPSSSYHVIFLPSVLSIAIS
jgi:hypothetical protein